MGLKISYAQGAIDKTVNSMKVVDVQGEIDKEVEAGYVADAQGAIDKKFYENWVYTTGEILNSSAGGGAAGTLTPAALADNIKLVKVTAGATIKAFTLEGGTYVVCKMQIQYHDGAIWVNLASATKTAYGSNVSFAANYSGSGSILTKQLRYILSVIGGDTDVIRQSMYGKCTEWYQKG